MKIITIIALLLSLSACATSGTLYETAVKAEKHKLEVIEHAQKQHSATIYSPEKMYFTHVDQSELTGVKYLGLGLSGFPTALTLKPGKHDFKLWKNGSPHFDLNIKGLDMKDGENYFVNYISKKVDKKVKLFYWVENINSGEVVQGRKRTLEELNNFKIQ